MAPVFYNVLLKRKQRGMPENQPPVSAESLPEQTPAGRAGGFNPISWIRDLALSVLIAVVLIVFIYQPVKVEGTSMMPALRDQERIFINKFTYRFGIGNIQRGDTVVFWFPGDISKSYIKRVIGLPGDTGGNRPWSGDCERQAPGRGLRARGIPRLPVAPARALRADEYFVLGDHRSSSNDSRAWGTCRARTFTGKPYLFIGRWIKWGASASRK
jgi:signal peptidase I